MECSRAASHHFCQTITNFRWLFQSLQMFCFWIFMIFRELQSWSHGRHQTHCWWWRIVHSLVNVGPLWSLAVHCSGGVDLVRLEVTMLSVSHPGVSLTEAGVCWSSVWETKSHQWQTLYSERGHWSCWWVFCNNNSDCEDVKLEPYEIYDQVKCQYCGKSTHVLVVTTGVFLIQRCGA